MKKGNVFVKEKLQIIAADVHKRVRLPCGGAMVTLRTFLNHEKANTNGGAYQTFVDSDTEDLVEAHFNAGYIFICVLSIYIYI